MNMNRLFMPVMVFVCLIFTACDKDEIVRPPMEWTWYILTPENVSYEGAGPGESQGLCFKANETEGDVVIICKNYRTLGFADTSLDSYDCGWATVSIEADKVKIHFPRYVSDIQEVSEEITITGRDGKVEASTVIRLTRTFDAEEQPDPEPVPDAAKFKLVNAGFSPFMHLDSPLPAPLDLITFRIKDINDNYSLLHMPEYTQYYDSIVWSADGFPNTFKIYENYETAEGKGQHFTSQWSSHIFRRGAIKTHLKGYCRGEVRYETSLNVDLYDRDFMCIAWGPVILQNPQNRTAYCLLDTEYEYTVNDILAKGENPFSKIIPVNNRQQSHSDFMSVAQKAIRTLMETNVGNAQNATGKESLFKCLPQEDIEAELYWENKTCRMLMVHQIPVDPDELMQEKYYLHIEPKQ